MPFAETFNNDMNHLLNNQDKTAGRKMSCSLQYALRLKGTPNKQRIPGGLEYPHYESYDFYFNRFLRATKTITSSPQFRISKQARDNCSKARWPDFVIVRSTSERSARDWMLLNRFVLAVIEIKPLSGFVSSYYDLEQVEASLEYALSTGQAQAREQAEYLFASNEDQRVVFAIHGSGPFWKYDIYERDLSSPSRAHHESEETYIANKLILREYMDVSRLQKLGTKESCKQFSRMLNQMKEKLGIADADW